MKEAISEGDLVSCASCKNLTPYILPYSEQEQICDKCCEIIQQMRESGEL